MTSSVRHPCSRGPGNHQMRFALSAISSLMTGGARAGNCGKSYTCPYDEPHDDTRRWWYQMVVAYRWFLQITVSGHLLHPTKAVPDMTRRNGWLVMAFTLIIIRTRFMVTWFMKNIYIYVYLCWRYMWKLRDVHGNPGLRVAFHPPHIASVITGNDKWRHDNPVLRVTWYMMIRCTEGNLYIWTTSKVLAPLFGLFDKDKLHLKN